MALWKERRFEVVVSPALLDELVEVLERPEIRQRVDPYRRLALLRRLRDDAVWVEGMAEAEELPDPQDTFLLQAALDGEARFLVTWDKALIDAGMRQGVEIVTPDQFIARLVRG